jgi:hypothetical protein
MNIRYTLILLALAVIATSIFVVDNNSFTESEESETSSYINYINNEYGISFSYPNTYVLNEIDADGSGMRKRHIITLINKSDLPIPVNGEGPTAITIDIYQNNLDKQTTEQWIKNTNASNFKLSDGNIATTTINDIPALSYRWSGLYEGTTVVTSNDNWVYVISVTYMEMGAQIIQDFVKIKNTIKLMK